MPMMEEFCDDPLGFGKEHAISLTWGGRLNPDEGRFHPRGGNAHDVRGANRILWFNVAPSVTFPNAAEVALQPMPAEDFVPAYFLPWDEDMIYRIQLKPSKVTTSEEYYHRKLGDLRHAREHAEDTESLDDRIDAIQAAHDTLAGVDPDFFFTAPVDGCSVYVEGTPDAPVVYHANAKNFGSSIYDATTQRQFQQFIDTKVDEMNRNFDTFRDNSPKAPVDNGISRVVTMNDYLGKTAQPKLYPAQATAELLKIAQKIIGNGRVVVNRDSIEIKQRTGTIFGKRVRGEWNFFVQNRIEVRHLTCNNNKRIAQQSWPRYLVSWVNPIDYIAQAYNYFTQTLDERKFAFSMQCEPFWPEGVGQVTYQ